MVPGVFRTAVAASLVGLLAGCATAPGKLAHDDLVWNVYEINKPLVAVYDGLQNNARNCGGLIDGYEPKWYPSQNMRSAKIDLYLKGGFGGVSDWVAGLIVMSEEGSMTKVDVGIQKPYSNPVFRANGWWKQRVENIVREIEAGAAPSCK